MPDEITASLESERVRHSMRIETEKLDLEKLRFRSEMVKWVAIAVGAVASFAVIDYGKLQLERFQSYAENQRELLKSYLSATDTTQPDVWTRKLKIIERLSEDEQLRNWASQEVNYIETSAGRDALFRETLTVASQLVDASQLDDPARKSIRARFNQLYWADLPFAKEGADVETAMVAFRKTLMSAETAGANDSRSWEATNQALLALSKVLRQEMDKSKAAGAITSEPPNPGGSN